MDNINVNFENQDQSDKNIEVTPNKIDSKSNSIIAGKITEQIGSGDNAKHSIIWMTIRWCFIIASVISLIIFGFLIAAYMSDSCGEINELKKFIPTIWSIFTPIITLALGYSFGKDYK